MLERIQVITAPSTTTHRSPHKVQTSTYPPQVLHSVALSHPPPHPTGIPQLPHRRISATSHTDILKPLPRFRRRFCTAWLLSGARIPTSARRATASTRSAGLWSRCESRLAQSSPPGVPYTARPAPDRLEPMPLPLMSPLLGVNPFPPSHHRLGRRGCCLGLGYRVHC